MPEGDVMRLSSTRTVTVGRADVALPAATNATAAIMMSSETFCISSPSEIELALPSLRRRCCRVSQAGTELASVPVRKCRSEARRRRSTAVRSAHVVVYAADAHRGRAHGRGVPARDRRPRAGLAREPAPEPWPRAGDDRDRGAARGAVDPRRARRQAQAQGRLVGADARAHGLPACACDAGHRLPGGPGCRLRGGSVAGKLGAAVRLGGAACAVLPRGSRPRPRPLAGVGDRGRRAPLHRGGGDVPRRLSEPVRGLAARFRDAAACGRGRDRRADPELRGQMKWLALAAMPLPLTLLVAWASYVTIHVEADAVVFVGLGLAYATIPTVIGIAVLRPGLFEVDRVLASTVAHVIATGVVLAIFTAANLAAGLLLPGDSVLAAVAATSLCALLLAPLRARLQQRVDRWLYPARRAALAAIEELNRQTATAQARPEQLEAVLQQAIGDATLRVGFLAADRTGVVDLAGASLEPAPGSVPVRLGGERIGLVVSGRTSRELLRDIAAAAAPTIEVIRLRLGLRQALREVEASRSRMLRAGYDERERLERDLHDGAQLRLVSLGMALRLAQRRLANGGIDVDGLLDQAVAELGTAVSELRQLANGIRPSCLDDGLIPALSVLVDA